MNNVHYSSKTPEWKTPQDFFDEIQKEFKLELDVCATNKNHKLWDWFTEKDDGLKQSWKGWRCWMNPPYGREIGKWVKKASEGGGGDCGCTSSCPYGYQMVSSIYLRKGRGSIYQRPTQVRGFEEFCSLS